VTWAAKTAARKADWMAATSAARLGALWVGKKVVQKAVWKVEKMAE
jgi:hypothetical protein